MKPHQRGWGICLLLAGLVAVGCSGNADTKAQESAETHDSKPSVSNAAGAASAHGQADTGARSVAGKQNPTGGAIGDVRHFDAILKKYVNGDYFDYHGLKSNATDLSRFEAFLSWQAAADLSEMSREEQIAFYINAYNSCCIKAILDHYPVHSPKDIDGFFDGLKFEVAGEELTISQIEYDRLIANYRDMRAHFAVVCADRGCLPLKAGAYAGETLHDDLEAAASNFISDPRQFKVDRDKKEIWISKIFEWYGPKFLNDPDRPVKDGRPELYLANWTDDGTSALLRSGDYTLKILEWNWTLNEKR